MIDLAHFSKAERVGATSATLRWTARLTVDTTLRQASEKESALMAFGKSCRRAFGGYDQSGGPGQAGDMEIIATL